MPARGTMTEYARASMTHYRADSAVAASLRHHILAEGRAARRHPFERRRWVVRLTGRDHGEDSHPSGSAGWRGRHHWGGRARAGRRPGPRARKRHDEAARRAGERARRALAPRAARAGGRAGGRVAHPAAGPARHHHAFGRPLRAASRGHSRGRPRRLPAPDPRAGRAADRAHAGRPQALPGHVAHLLPGVLGQLSAGGRAGDEAGERLRHDLHDGMDRRVARDPVPGGRRPAGRHVVPGRGAGRGGDDAQRPDGEGLGRRADCLRAERRGAAAGAGLPGAAAAAGLGGQLERQVAAAPGAGRSPVHDA